MKNMLAVLLAAAPVATAASVANGYAPVFTPIPNEYTALKVLALTKQAVSDFNISFAKIQSPACNSGNIARRQEYGALSKSERLDYINAVKCLMALPNRTPANVAPGARSRFDDFIVTHLQQTRTIHFTGNFLAWHRWFVWNYENALRTECGYKGWQPYWDWPKWASAPQDSPMFNGDPYSLSGNGQYVPHNQTAANIPNGLGGGYVTTGPFANMITNLGPVDLANAVPGPDGGLGYNPRRFKRDVGPAVATQNTNYTSVLDLLSRATFDDFNLVLQGSLTQATLGLHGGGHYTINGDPGGDVYISPGDPGFWIHHGNVDRMWTLWQAMDPANRQLALGVGNYSHITWGNDPVSRLTSLDDVISIGYAGPNTTIRDIMNTTSSLMCYYYD
ncbi:Di-copper centre-containing protein [Xylariaceae sp. FL0255]|nr:Di-copper centre-containing protein [Xylariaceae sp. FL0255]